MIQTEKESHCQLEVDIVYDRLLGHAPEGKWSKLAPLRILSFDIECQVRPPPRLANRRFFMPLCLSRSLAHPPEAPIHPPTTRAQGRKGHFPEAEKDPVIQIANVLSVQGKSEPLVKNVFTLNGCLPIVGAQVRAVPCCGRPLTCC